MSKSKIMRRAAKKFGLKVINLKIVQMKDTDLRGLLKGSGK